MILAKPFYLVRHGESESNRQRVLAGCTDTPLSERGRQQARELCAAARGGLMPQPDIMLCSGLSRARDTALALNESLRLPLRENAGLNERDFGAWVGMPGAGLLKRMANGETPPEGESLDIFAARIKAAFNEVLAQAERPVIVAHGGVFDALAALCGRRSIDVENCHMYRFDPVAGQDVPWRIWHYRPEPSGLRPVETAIFQI